MAKDKNIVDGLPEYMEDFAEAVGTIQTKADRINAYRRHASRLASKANKRIKRLEKMI